MVDFKKQGKTNRAKGNAFELKVRKKYEAKGWIVDKWSNNVDLDAGCFVQAKNKFLPGRGLMPGLGFPDFVIFKRAKITTMRGEPDVFSLVFIECKTNNTLTKLEKQKLDWLTKQGYRCYVAYQDGKEIGIRAFVEYTERNNVCRKDSGDNA